MTAFDYARPASLDEAIDLLAANAGARALAGGHSLLLEPNRSRLPAALLVDLRKLPGLNGVQAGEQDGSVAIGAMTPLERIAGSALLQERYPALAEAAQSIGDAQVRNRATLGGNLADNDPGSDLVAAILALNAAIQLAGPRGLRALPADQFSTGPFQTALSQGELITGVTLAAPPAHTGSAYEKFTHPATRYAVCGVAAAVTLTTDGVVSACRIGVTGATTYPQRLHAAEAALVGQWPDDPILELASEQAREGLAYNSDPFASAVYRSHLLGVLTVRALRRAIEVSHK